MRDRLVAGVLCLALVLGLLPAAGLVQPAEAAYWADPYGQQLVEWGVMRGDISGNLNLANPITRAEFVTMCTYHPLIQPVTWHLQPTSSLKGCLQLFHLGLKKKPAILTFKIFIVPTDIQLVDLLTMLRDALCLSPFLCK